MMLTLASRCSRKYGSSFSRDTRLRDSCRPPPLCPPPQGGPPGAFRYPPPPPMKSLPPPSATPPTRANPPSTPSAKCPETAPPAGPALFPFGSHPPPPRPPPPPPRAPLPPAAVVPSNPAAPARTSPRARRSAHSLHRFSCHLRRMKLSLCRVLPCRTHSATTVADSPASTAQTLPESASPRSSPEPPSRPS